MKYPKANRYIKLDSEEQVRLQISLARNFAMDWFDEPYFDNKKVKERIKLAMIVELNELIEQEKYELCQLYHDTIENLEYISVRQLL
tara:strand:- start:198 stop:458 length:261 start_codon:yes stop_codon:yes gene_type:complete